MKHYWNSELDEDFIPEFFDFEYEKQKYTMFSSRGVFSAFKADEGSLILTSILLKEIKKYMDGLSSEELKLFNALDLGCGNGLISLLISNLNPNYKGEMVDVNPRAIRLSELNIEKFNKRKALRVFESDKFTNVENKYDIIFTNPPIRTGKTNIYSIFDQSIEYLQTGGLFFVVIRKNHGAKSAINKLEEIYNNCQILKKHKGYYVIFSKKMRNVYEK